ncbi:MAG: nucleotidyltransferase family protein [Oscillospiraceae bacterium]|nr:nucleotidyltransferase family protein [Oscillospiraceae bacterium]
MSLTGIIAEFNPFHLGHAVPIAAARAAMDGGGAVVCILSGNCVQRGDLAIFHKTARAKAAIRAGADLVIELPAPYVLSSAERFARGGVALLAAMNQPDTRLAFGCETADAEALVAVAHALNTPEVQTKIKAKMGEGFPYGAACQAALDALVASPIAALLQTPNNLLGIEYLRAIHRLGASITPLPVQRRGVEHNSTTPAEGYASATHLRSLIHGDTSPWPYMPEAATEIFQQECAAGRGPASLEQLEATVLSLLRLKDPPKSGYMDDSEGLSIRIRTIATQVGSLAELLEKAKAKRYHLSRIRRLVLTMCLGLTPDHRPEMPPYIRVLAANQIGTDLLRSIAKTAHLPILSRPGEAKKLGASAAEMMRIESAVTDLQALCFQKTERKGGREWKTLPFLSELEVT